MWLNTYMAFIFYFTYAFPTEHSNTFTLTKPQLHKPSPRTLTNYMGTGFQKQLKTSTIKLMRGISCRKITDTFQEMFPNHHGRYQYFHKDRCWLPCS